MTDEVFKIKVNRDKDFIYILEQPDDLPNGLIVRCEGVEIRRACCPEYRKSSRTLFLRGCDKTQDSAPLWCRGDKQLIIQAIKELCEDRMYKFVKVGDNVIGEIE